MEFTDHFGLAKLEPGEGIHSGSGQYPWDDRDRLDELLHRALTHRHTGADLVGPEAPLYLELEVGGGSIPADTTVRYRYTIVDPIMGETPGSDLSTLDTPAALPAPSAPSATVQTIGGALDPGSYYYVASQYVGESTVETEALNPVYVTVPAGSETSTVTLQLPPLHPDASGFNVYRRAPGQPRYYLHGTTTATTYVDDGLLPYEYDGGFDGGGPVGRSLPSKNTTSQTAAISVLLQASLEDGQQWRLYRSYSDNFSNSLVGQYTSDTYWVVDQGDATGPGSPPGDLMISAPSKVLLTDGAEVQGTLPAEMVEAGGFTHLSGGNLQEVLRSVDDVIAGGGAHGATVMISGDGVTDTFHVAHNLGSTFFTLQAWDVSGGVGSPMTPVTITEVILDSEAAAAAADVKFGSPPATGSEVALYFVAVDGPPPSMAFTYDTDLLSGTNTTIQLPLNGAVDGRVDWGDGTVEVVNSPLPSHTYDASGVYSVKFYGVVPHIGVTTGSASGNPALLSVDHWDTSSGTTSMHRAFANARNLTYVAEPPPTVINMEWAFDSAWAFNHPSIADWDMSNVQGIRGMFYGASRLNQDLSGWDVRNVTNLDNLFGQAHAFNGDVTTWDTSNVTSMQATFDSAYVFNQDITVWDTTNVTNMSAMFNNASAFNQDISVWDVSSVTNMRRMLSGGYERPNSFNQDLNNWDVSNVTNMDGVFSYNVVFAGGVSTWDTSSVTDMRSMFSDATAFNDDLSNWDTSNVTDMRFMFDNAVSFDSDLSGWDTSNVTNMASMFAEAESFTGGIGGWNTSRVTTMSGMFQRHPHFNDDLSNWNTSNVTSMSQMFYEAEAFNSDITGWNTSRVTTMNSMFSGSTSFNQDITQWDTSRVTDMRSFLSRTTAFNQDLSTLDISRVTAMSNMFAGTTFNPNVSNWDVSGVTDMWAMFRDAQFDRDLSNWNTSNVTSMSRMFDGTNFNGDISSWNVSNVRTMDGMFADNPEFNQNISGWDVSRVYDMWEMFRNATAFNQDLSEWDVSAVTYYPAFDAGATAWTLPRPQFT